VSVKRSPAPLVHHPCRRADIFVAESRDVLLDEVDEPALALQQ
jgi:hypothetical protein